jgi:hypothetical protein
VARHTFRIGPIKGRAEARVAPYHDGYEIHTVISTFERDTGEFAEIHSVKYLDALAMHGITGNYIEMFVQDMYHRMWEHEFDEGFLVDGVRKYDPHVIKGTPGHVVLDELADA